MMPRAYYLLVAALFVADAALARWKPAKPHLLRSGLALVIAYVPMVVLPPAGPLVITLAAGLVGSAGLVSYARLVGLWSDRRAMAVTLVCSWSFFVAARVHWYGLFQAMPVFAMLFVASVGSIRAAPHTFLQRTALSWVGLLVYGYLFAHAAIFTDVDLGRLAHAGPPEAPETPASVWIALVLVCAKAADVAWEVACRLRSKADEMQVPCCAIGGVAGGLALHLVFPEALGPLRFALLGLTVGFGTGSASRTYKLIVTDVAGEDPGRPMKGTMLFGFAWALTLAFHFVNYLAFQI